MTLENMGNVVEFLVLLVVAITLVYLTVRIPRNTRYRCAVGLALAGAFVVVWMNLAVGIIGQPENLAKSLLILNGKFIIVWVGSALLFRHAARERSET